MKHLSYISLFLVVSWIASPDLALSEEQEKVIVISEKVGEVIDKEEREQYKLFPQIKGFKSAVILQLADDGFVAEVTYEEEGEEKIRRIPLTADAFTSLKDVFKDFAEAHESEMTVKEQATAQAIADAKRDIDNSKWHLTGFCLGPVGVMMANSTRPVVKEERLIGKSREYIDAYTSAYIITAWSYKTSNARKGCITSTGALITCVVGYFYLAFEAAQ